MPAIHLVHLLLLTALALLLPLLARILAAKIPPLLVVPLLADRHRYPVPVRRSG